MAKTIDEQAESILIKFGVFHHLQGAPREAMAEAIRSILLAVARDQQERDAVMAEAFNVESVEFDDRYSTGQYQVKEAIATAIRNQTLEGE